MTDKYQLVYHSRNSETEINETVVQRSLRGVKRYLSGQKVIGSAMIYHIHTAETYYYKPRV